MNLTVKDIGRLLKVSEKTVSRWVKEEGLPAYRIQEQLRFNRAEVLEWATARRIPVSPTIFDEPGDTAVPSLEEALRSGGVHYGVSGEDRASILGAVVELLPLPEGTDRSLLNEMLLARENLGSTAVGNGIAIPHPRFPVVLPPAPETLSLCFLDRPVEFGALDGKPVHTLFVMVGATVKGHLRLLSRLAFALQDETFRRLLEERAVPERLLAAAAEADARTAQGS